MEVSPALRAVTVAQKIDFGLLRLGYKNAGPEGIRCSRRGYIP